ncbi:MAG TPA: STAS domain-containing protein [Phytomonospora sp.]
MTGFDAPEGLRIEVADEAGVRLVRLCGEMDIAVQGAVANEFHSLVADAPGVFVVVDMSEVGFCDSSGIGMLIRSARELWKRDGGLRLAAPQEHIVSVLRTNGLLTALPVFDSVEAASVVDD